MQYKKSTQGKKRIISTSLAIGFICIMLIRVNVLGGENPENIGNNVITDFDKPKTEVSVSIGTDKANIPLPEKLTATLKSQEKAEVAVTWDDGGRYDKDTAGVYTFTADIGSFSYAKERPVAVVTVNPNTEPGQQEQKEDPIVPVPFTAGQTPVIDSTILPNKANTVAVINEADSVQTGYASLEAAMQAIGTNSGSYTVVFVQGYSLTTADKKAVAENGGNVQLTITSTYKDNSNASITRDINSLAADTWICNSDTTFKDISLSSYLNIYGNCHKLVIGAGVTCASSNGNIYGGGSAGMTGNTDVTILSGVWSSVKSGGLAGTMNGSAAINIGGTAVITGQISAAANVAGKVTVNVDGTGGAIVQSFSENTAAGEYKINLNNAKIKGNLSLGNANLNISGGCTVGNTIAAGTTAGITIKLSDGASLSNGTSGSFDCPKGKLVFGALSKLTCNGGTNRIGHIVIEGDGAQLYVKKGYAMTVSGTFTGKNKLNVDFINDKTPEPFDKLLTFSTKTNANKNHYAYPRTNGYDGIVTVDGHVVYFDFVPPKGYVYDWYGTESLYVGGHNIDPNVDDLKCQFGLSTGMDQKAFRLMPGQLTAKIKGYKKGKAFSNYYRGKEPDFGYTIKVGSVVYYLVINGSENQTDAKGNVFRGYKKSADGSRLDLVFYLGREVGIVYLHLTINPGSLVMSESWDYINLSSGTQNIVMSHGGDITFAGNDNSYCISSRGQDMAFAFQSSSEPVMFMWVDQPTTANPAAAGKYNKISQAVRTGTPFADTIPKTVDSGGFIDTEMGIQWQYKVAAQATQSTSGGTAFGKLGGLQITGKDVTFVNPDKEDTSKAVSHGIINFSKSKITISKGDWSIEGLPAGITVTKISDPVTIPASGTAKFEITYSVSHSIPPRNYPVKFTFTKEGKKYTFTDNITVKRDEVKINATVKNEDNTENTAAISGITVAATYPVTSGAIYKYYDGRLSWTLNSTDYEIKKITVGGTELTSAELNLAKANNYLTYAQMTEDKAVVIYVGEPSKEPTNKAAVSKTAAGGSAGRAFAFTITVHDKGGAVLTEGTELNCKGGIITGSGATAPTTTRLILDANGQAKFNLGNGQALEIMGIPAEGKIRVAETAVTGYEAAHTVDGKASAAADQKDTGLLDMGSMDRRIAFYNTHLDDLTVSKAVEGEFGDKTKAFSFNISIKDKAGGNVTKTFVCDGGVLTGSAYTGVTAPASGILSISNGVGSFTLKHGQSITIRHLDPSYKIQVTEADPGTSYTTKYIKDGAGADGRAVREFTLGGKNAVINYTNTRALVPATGIQEGSHSWIPVLGVALVGCVILGFVAYRHGKAR